jgi:hypothetical protein
MDRPRRERQAPGGWQREELLKSQNQLRAIARPAVVSAMRLTDEHGSTLKVELKLRSYDTLNLSPNIDQGVPDENGHERASALNSWSPGSKASRCVVDINISFETLSPNRR